MAFFDSLMAFILKSILSDMSIATPTFLSCLLTWNIFSHCLTFNLYVSFALSWVSCVQHFVGFCFFMESASLHLLIRVFSPLTFKVIIYKYVFIANFNLVFQLIPCFPYVPAFFGSMISFFACVLFFLVFVNVMFGFDFCLPCFFKYVNHFVFCLL